MFLQLFEPFVVYLIYVPVVLSEELVDCSFALCGKDLACDPCHGLVAGGNKTCGAVGVNCVNCSRTITQAVESLAGVNEAVCVVVSLQFKLGNISTSR
jgi:hypothetical protein